MSVRIIEAAIAQPTNRTYQHQGSIHDDATAQQLGFRGGTVAASTHLDTFPPVLIAAYGERWFEDGCLSLYFRTPTVDGEPVRAGLLIDDEGVAAASLVTPDGVVVAEGTAHLGRTHQSALSMRDLRHDPDGVRILARVHAADAIGAARVHCPSSAQSRRVFDGLIASPIEWYHGPSPWGPSVTAPSSAMEMFTQVAAAYLGPRVQQAVGLWGAMELRYHGEPLMCDTEYSVEGRVVAVGQSPRTETLWYDMAASDAQGYLVATARVLTRFAKASSPLYQKE
jgi:hypothetical protein